MADIFSKTDAQNTVKNRVIWFLGDSNVRAIYKDLIWLLQKGTFISLKSLRNKLEDSYMNDKLLKGKQLHKGRNYIEVRCFEDSSISTKIEFTFITECLSSEIRDKLTHLNNSDSPDIVVMNSCLWDITRWGPDGVSRYKQNVEELLLLFRCHLPPETLVIWTTTPPLSAEPMGGFLINQINFMKPYLRFEVMEANMFLRTEVVRHGFDLLDIHYNLLLQIHRRRPDGIHWNPDAVRHMTNLLLTHIALSLGVPLPGNFSSPFLDKLIHTGNSEIDTNNNIIKGKNYDGNKGCKSITTVPTATVKTRSQDSPKKTASKNNGKNRRKRCARQKSGRFYQDQNAAPFTYGNYSNNSKFSTKMMNYNVNRQQRNNKYYRPY